MARWNASAGGRWNRLVQDLRRELGDKVEYFAAKEVQRRGALHFHVLVRSSDGRPVALSGGVLRALAIRHGFGHSVDVQPVAPNHAAYVSKYVSKSADARHRVPWKGWGHRTHRDLDRATGEVTEVRTRVRTFDPTYRTWSASRGWGRSMAEVRAAQQHFVLVLAALPSWADAPARRAWSCLDVPSVPGWADPANPLVEDPPGFLVGAGF